MRHRPACALLALALRLLLAPALAAQDGVPVLADAPVLKDPAGVVLATVPRGTIVRAAPAVNGWSAVTLDGWIFSTSLTADARDGFDVAVSAAGGENLRADPKGAVVARLRSGVLLNRVETRGAWVHVRRTGVIAAAAVSRTASADTTPRSAQAPAAGPATDTAADTSGQHVGFARSAQLALAPEGTSVGTLGPGAIGSVVGHSGDWVHVRVDGWVRERDVKGPTAGIGSGVTAAALRASPERYVGTAVEWRVQFIALRVADELRPDLPAGQAYLLMRGPLPEPGFVYVMVNAEQAARFRDLTPLAEVTIRATIRTPRSKYIGTPIVELVSIVGDP